MLPSLIFQKPSSGEIYNLSVGCPSASVFPHLLLLWTFQLKGLEESLPSSATSCRDLTLLWPSPASLVSPPVLPIPSPKCLLPPGGKVQSSSLPVKPLQWHGLQIWASFARGPFLSLCFLSVIFLNSWAFSSFWKVAIHLVLSQDGFKLT